MPRTSPYASQIRKTIWLNPKMQTETPRLPLARRAAQYVRMSTEHQQYSTENQGDKIKEYAARNDIEIVRTYADEGKSGLNIGGREGLQKLLADVRAGKTEPPRVCRRLICLSYAAMAG